MKLGLLLFLGALLAACTSNTVTIPDNHYSDDYTGVPERASILLLPVSPTRDEYRSGVTPVTRLLVEDLKTRHSVETVAVPLFNKAWLEAIESVGGIYSASSGAFDRGRYQQAVKQLVKALNPEGEHDIVIFPTLVERQAESTGKYAKWDGVRRANITDGLDDARFSRWHGSVGAVSLQLNSFDGQGTWLSTSYGGLVLPHYYSIEDKIPRTHQKDDMFADEKALDEGIRLAVVPFLGPVVKGQ